jgi:hypothetical protein
MNGQMCGRGAVIITANLDRIFGSAADQDS